MTTDRHCFVAEKLHQNVQVHLADLLASQPFRAIPKTSQLLLSLLVGPSGMLQNKLYRSLTNVTCYEQLIPFISSLTPVTTAVPLIFVLTLTAFKDAIDDIVSAFQCSMNWHSLLCLDSKSTEVIAK